MREGQDAAAWEWGGFKASDRKNQNPSFSKKQKCHSASNEEKVFLYYLYIVRLESTSPSPESAFLKKGGYHLSKCI